MLTLPSFGLVRARSLPEAIEALSDGRALPIAGGTDVVPNMKRGLLEPARLVSVRRIPELTGVRVEEDGSLVLGAATTLAEIAGDARVARTWPGVAQAVRAVASPQIRNAGTLGGNVCLDTRCAYYDQSKFWRSALGHCLKTCGEVCHVVPHGHRCVAAFSADTPPALIASGARVRLASQAGERTMALSDFYTSDGAHHTVRRPDEILVDVRIPLPPPRTQGVYVKVRARAAIDFPILSMAVVLTRDRDETVQSIAVVVGALASKPRVVDGLDAIAVGRPLDGRVIEAVADRAHAVCHPLANLDGDAGWRRTVLPVYVRRALAALAASPT